VQYTEWCEGGACKKVKNIGTLQLTYQKWRNMLILITNIELQGFWVPCNF
jgi:hypothetical protein